MTSAWMHVHMQIFTHKGENVQLQLGKQPTSLVRQQPLKGWSSLKQPATLKPQRLSCAMTTNHYGACLTTQLGIIKDEWCWKPWKVQLNFVGVRVFLRNVAKGRILCPSVRCSGGVAPAGQAAEQGMWSFVRVHYQSWIDSSSGQTAMFEQ